MDHSTGLLELPSGIAFPEHLQGRVRFDPAKQQLIFSGFMTKRTYDELTSLSSNMDYRRAVERLFVLSSNGVGEPTSVPLGRLTASLAVLGTIVVVLLIALSLLRQYSNSGARGPDLRLTNAAENK